MCSLSDEHQHLEQDRGVLLVLWNAHVWTQKCLRRALMSPAWILAEEHCTRIVEPGDLLSKYLFITPVTLLLNACSEATTAFLVSTFLCVPQKYFPFSLKQGPPVFTFIQHLSLRRQQPPCLQATATEQNNIRTNNDKILFWGIYFQACILII